GGGPAWAARPASLWPRSDGLHHSRPGCPRHPVPRLHMLPRTFMTRQKPEDEMDEKPYVTEIEIRYRDTDSMGHVSSPIYYDYLQSAYLEYMHDLLRLPKDRKLPHIMVRTSCEYVSQAVYGDRINVL